MPGCAVYPLRALAFWILLLFLVLCLAGCGPAPAGPGSEPPASGQTQSPREETQRTQPTHPAAPAPTSLLAATVTKVIDGDTAYIRLENGRTEKVRFIGVDTPETHHPTIGEEPYGREAAAFTAKSLSGRKVWLELDVQERDHYGRLLAYVWLVPPRDTSENEVRTRMFNARLLTEGYAQILTVAPNVKYADLFVKLQREARDAKKGLWGAPAPAASGRTPAAWDRKSSTAQTGVAG